MPETIRSLLLLLSSVVLVEAWRTNVAGLPIQRNIYQGVSCYTIASEGLASQDWQPAFNFLATQVWPSARIAAESVTQNLPHDCRAVCELGCGPGLPSLTAASVRTDLDVYATDLDTLAMELVKIAAEDQGLTNVFTQQVDLLSASVESLPNADLYILSDVFESNDVAKASARLMYEVLQRKVSSRVWVFAQSDRAQRQMFLQQIQLLTGDNSLSWETSLGSRRLWLCNVDETVVAY